jgi:hypothetical protein
MRVTREAKERLWFVFSLCYAIARVLGAKAFLARYGLNIVSFAIIEIVSSALLAVTSSGLVRAIVANQKSPVLREPASPDGFQSRHPKVGPIWWWALAVGVFFSAPDVYAYLATDHLPTVLVGMLGLALLASAISSVVVIQRKVREGRRRPKANDVLQ